MRLRTGAGSEVVVERVERAFICVEVMVRLEGASCWMRIFISTGGFNAAAKFV